MSKTTLTIAAEQVRTETIEKANSSARVGQVLKDIITEMVSKDAEDIDGEKNFKVSPTMPKATGTNKGQNKAGVEDQITERQEAVRSQSTTKSPTSKAMDDQLKVVEDGMSYKGFTNKQIGNKFIKEAYLSGAGLNSNKIYYLDLVVRQDATYGNGFFIKESDSQFLNPTVIISVLYKTEGELSGFVSASNPAGTINLKMILDWSAFSVGVNTGETLKCVFNANAFNRGLSPYIFSKENIVNIDSQIAEIDPKLSILERTVDAYMMIDSDVVYNSPEAGNDSYSHVGVTALGCYRKVTSDCLINQVKVYAGAPSVGYIMNVRVYKSPDKPVAGDVPSSAYSLIQSSAEVWDNDESSVKEIKIPATVFLQDEYIVVMFATLANHAPKIRRYTSNAGGRIGFMFSQSTNYMNVFSESFLLGDETSGFAQAMPGIASVSYNKKFDDEIKDLQLNKSDAISPRITLPSVVFAAQGVEFNLYYDAITLGADAGLGAMPMWSVQVLCDIGYSLDRCFHLNPSGANVGDHDLHVHVYNNARELIASKSVTLRVVPAIPPSEIRNLLLVGDSTLNNGPLAPWLRSRFTTLGGSVPVLHGGKGIAPARHQGWPGASFQDYATVAFDTRFEFTVTGASTLEQDASYSNNGSVFVIQDIYTTAGAGKIRAMKISGVNAPSASGALIKTGGNGPSAISYSSFSVVSSNPLWNNTTSQVDVENYRSMLGMGVLFDVVAIRLGVNDSLGNLRTEAQRATIIQYAKTIIDAFLSDNADCKIIVELPTTDGNTRGGWGANYGAAGKKEEFQANVWRLRELMIEEFDNAAYHENVLLCATGCCIDRYYSYDRESIQVASVIPIFADVHTNALHPATEGYYQLADALYPSILNALNLIV